MYTIKMRRVYDGRSKAASTTATSGTLPEIPSSWIHPTFSPQEEGESKEVSEREREG